MSKINQEEEKSFNNLSKIYSVSINSNRNKVKINPLEIDENNPSKRNIFRNAGKELLDSHRHFTSEENCQNPPFSQGIISWKHKGIKRKGHSFYDPYLIQVCKNAIIRERKELPNYKEIIKKVNTEYGIEDEKFNERHTKMIKNNFNFNNIQMPIPMNIATSNNTSNFLKDINNSAMSTNINEKR